MPHLIKILDFDLIGYTPDIPIAAQQKISGHIILNKDDWNLSFCKDFKDSFKPQTSRKQKRKCMYCRTTINVDGSGNAIEHITPRKLKPHWMFVIKNLAVACDNCNSSKNDTNVLRLPATNYGDQSNHFPNTSVEHLIYNPHFDKWSDHFDIEDEYFLKAKPNTKGPFTYQLCNMHRYHIIIDYLDELKIRQPFSYRILGKRIRKEKDPKKIEALKTALEYIEDLMNQNDN